MIHINPPGMGQRKSLSPRILFAAMILWIGASGSEAFARQADKAPTDALADIRAKVTALLSDRHWPPTLDNTETDFGLVLPEAEPDPYDVKARAIPAFGANALVSGRNYAFTYNEFIAGKGYAEIVMSGSELTSTSTATCLTLPDVEAIARSAGWQDIAFSHLFTTHGFTARRGQASLEVTSLFGPGETPQSLPFDDKAGCPGDIRVY